MTRRRRHIASLLFTILILLPVLAITFLQAAQAYIKIGRDERLGSGKPEQVLIPARDIIWEEEEKELWVGNRMFDVSSVLLLDGVYHLTGAYDAEETWVANALRQFLLSDESSGLLHLLLLLQCFAGALCLVGFILPYRLLPKQGVAYFPLFPNPSYLVLCPPPQC